MKILKLIGIPLVVWVAVVVIFESLIGYFQPANQDTLVITTRDADGNTSDRVLSKLTMSGKLYVAANHWPRDWYNQALADPAVQITQGETTADYVAVPVSDAEHTQLDTEHALPLVVRILTGFPPRYFVRLDPA